jgi:hypothetical protein
MTLEAKDTRQPALTKAVLENIDSDYLEDVCNHGADGGYGNFVYYSDTVKFFDENKDAILERLKEDALSFGCDALEMVCGFGCLRSFELSSIDIAAAIYEADSEWETQVKNALAWYALEEVAREVVEA